MKVLFLVSRDIRHPSNTGGDIGMWERAQYLASAGHQITVMASRFPGAPRREVIDGIDVIRMGGLLWLWLTTFVFYMTEARGRYDVVVTEGFGGSRIPRLAPVYVREPVITEWHQIHSELFAHQYPRVLVPVLNLLERLTARVHRGTILMARTEEWRRAFPTLGFKPENIRVVPACIREDRLRSVLPNTVDPNFVWIGKFRKYKCPDHAILAMSEVVRQLPTARLILAGFHDDRAYESRLDALVRRLDLEESISLRFAVADEEKQRLLDAARALLITSPVEGFGIVVLEANSRGVPVIASSGVPDSAVQGDVNGLRYPFGEISTLATAMLSIARDDALHGRLAKQSIEFCSKFTWREVCARYEQVVKDAMLGQPRRQPDFQDPAPGPRTNTVDRIQSRTETRR